MWKRGSGGWEVCVWGGRSHRKKRKPIIVSKNMYLAETKGMHVASDSSVIDTKGLNNRHAHKQY